jgi:SAM-dependent methyltransferase
LGVSQLSELVRRLDANVAESLAKATHELTESHRYTAGTLSKLVADQIQTAEIDRQSRSISQVQPIVDAAAHIAPPLRPLKTVKLPAMIHKWLAKQGVSPSQSVWCLNQKQLPQTPEDLPKLLEIMAACRQRLQPGEHLVWARQGGAEPLLTPSEIQQLLGLIGPAQGPIDVDDEGRKWCIAIVERRIEAVSVVLRWSIPALEDLHIRLRPLADEMLARLKLQDTAHAVDLPELDADVGNWARLLPSLVATVTARGGVPIGITLPSGFDEALDKMDDAVAHLRRALRDGGHTQDISFQWVRGSLSVGKSFAVLDFARRHGIGFDLTPVNRGARESRLAAYDDRLPYRPLSFDLRLPSFAAPNEAVIEIPRWPGRALDTHTIDGELHDLGALLDREFEQCRRRLDRVLDRARQKQFELQVNLDATQMDYWPQYFVHNWSPPAAAWLRLFEFDAVELFSKGSPLLQVCPGERTEAGNAKFLSGSQFLAAATKFAFTAPAAKTLRRYQIDAHSYLRNRFEITADAERLITWMPESLGITLELGSGFGVMARRLQKRAQSYIGFDLTLDQASALRELGGVGLLADMQAMPFPDSIFDTIVADNVVEHATDPLQVLLECHRVLKPGGNVFMVIPPDYRRSDFCNEAHLWKSDEESVREALRRAGLRVVRQETIHLSDHGVSGAFPSSDGETGLWHVEKMAATLSATKSKQVGEKAK